MTLRERYEDFVEWQLITRWQAVVFHVAPPITTLLIKALLQVNQSKDRSLAWKLHYIADRYYDPRPTNNWESHE